jgi:hypothetical protein
VEVIGIAGAVAVVLGTVYLVRSRLELRRARRTGAAEARLEAAAGGEAAQQAQGRAFRRALGRMLQRARDRLRKPAQ